MQLRVHDFHIESIPFGLFMNSWVASNCAGIRVLCRASASETVEETEKKRVLVMGGTGRVGGSTLRALAKGGDLHLIVGGRNRYHKPPCCILVNGKVGQFMKNNRR